MALGAHWEWRGFGRGSPGLRDSFESLEELFPPLHLVDRYIWIPGSSVNVKLRKGIQDGLKFKRLLGTDGDLEQWLEDPAELYDFPLEPAAWEKLGAELRAVGLDPPSVPPEPSDLQTTLECLETVDERITIVEVHKHRRARLFRGPHGPVAVEWAQITRPETVTSVGIESWTEAAVEAIRQVILDLRLEVEAIQPMNYLAATGIWAGGGVIGG
jgi:hypothetical protein